MLSSKTGKNNKKSFAIMAIIVGTVGVAIGAYSIFTVSSRMAQPAAQSNNPTSLSNSIMEKLVSNDSPPLGSPSAPITIIEFGDYQCKNCQRFNTQVKPMLVDEYVDTNKVRLIFMDFPIYGTDSVNGAIATHCASEQSRFWEMHDLMYQSQKEINSDWLTASNVKQFAASIDLDLQQFSSCFDSMKYEQAVKDNFDMGKTAGVNATPTFIIIDSNGMTETIVGAQPFSVFKQTLDRMLEDE